MQQNELLNNVLIVMSRTLLQYAAQAWPWLGSEEASLGAEIDKLIAEQSARIQRLCDLLESRRWPIDFGAFPDFTDMTFLALDFVLPHLVANERLVVREIETGLRGCAGDAEGADLLSELLEGERATLARLESLAKSHDPVSTV